MESLPCKNTSLRQPRLLGEHEITLKEITKLKKELYTIISNHSEQDFDKVEQDSDRDYWMTSTEAKEYGMIDEVLTGKRG